MVIQSMFMKKEETQFEEGVNIIDPKTEKEFLKVNLLETDEFKDKKYIGKVEKANMFLQQIPLIPNIQQNNLLKDAYKVVMPEGAVETMMKYKNGMLGTPLIGADGKIKAHCGLVKIDNVSLTPLMIFTAMSFITGQYFMAKIEKGLQCISKEVKNIIDLIYDEKESDAVTAYNFYEYIKRNLDFILSNESLKLSTLTNIQIINNKIYSNIMFYSKSINREINNLKNILIKSKFTNRRLNEVEELSTKFLDLITQQHLCFELFCIGKIYEMQISEVYDSKYCENLIYELNTIGNHIDKDIKSLITKSEDIFLEILKGAAIKGKEAISKYKHNSNIYSNKQVEFEKNKKGFIEGINSFNNENKKLKEFFVVGDSLYI